MSKVILTADSGVNSASDNIEIIPCMITGKKDGKVVYDFPDYGAGRNSSKNELSNLEILEARKNGVVFTTAQPTPGSYRDVLNRLVEQGEVLNLSMTRSASGAASLAETIANEMNESESYPNKIYTFDTSQLGCGGTFISELADELVRQGKSVQEVIQMLEEYKEKLLVSYTVPDPRGFKNSGKGYEKDGTSIKSVGDRAKELLAAGVTGAVAKLPFASFRVNMIDGKLTAAGITRETSPLKLVKKFVSENDLEKLDHSIAVLGAVLPTDPFIEDSTNAAAEYLSDLGVKCIVKAKLSGVVPAYACGGTNGIAMIRN